MSPCLIQKRAKPFFHKLNKIVWYVLIQLEDISLGAKYNFIFSIVRKGEGVTLEVFFSSGS